MRTRFLWAAISLLIVAACSKLQEAEDATGQMPDPVSVRVCGNIHANGLKARVVNDVWETGDAIGISGESGTVEYANRQYTFSNGSSFLPAGEVIYYIDEKTAEFSAYYPFNEAGGTLEIEVGNQCESKSFDYLYATAQGSESAPLLDFRFRHQLCKVVLNFLPGSGFAGDAAFSGVTLRLASLHSAGTFNTATGEARANEEAAETLEFTAGATIMPEGNTYSLLLLPETVSGGVALSLIQEDGTVCEGAVLTDKDSSDLTLTAGKVYEYNVTVNRHQLTVSSSAIHGWDDTPGEKDVNVNI